MKFILLTYALIGNADRRSLIGYHRKNTLDELAHEATGVDPNDIPVVELHDCFAHNEQITYEALGLSPEAVRKNSSSMVTIPMAVAP